MRKYWAPLAAALASFVVNAHVPRRMRTTEPLRSGVLAGSAEQASSATVVSSDVAYRGSVPLMGTGNTESYTIALSVALCTSARCTAMTVLSRDAAEMTSMPLPGLDVYHEPYALH